MTAVQTGPTSIRVTWTPPTPLGDTTGYIISYTNDDDSDSGSVTVSGGSTDMETLTGLQNGDTYTISIVATSQHFFSYTLQITAVTLYEGTSDYWDFQLKAYLLPHVSTR